VAPDVIANNPFLSFSFSFSFFLLFLSADIFISRTIFETSILSQFLLFFRPFSPSLASLPCAVHRVQTRACTRATQLLRANIWRYHPRARARAHECERRIFLSGAIFFFQPASLSLSLSLSLSFSLLARRAISPIYFCRGRARARGETRHADLHSNALMNFRIPSAVSELAKLQYREEIERERERERKARGIALLFFDICEKGKEK